MQRRKHTHSQKSQTMFLITLLVYLSSCETMGVLNSSTPAEKRRQGQFVNESLRRGSSHGRRAPSSRAFWGSFRGQNTPPSTVSSAIDRHYAHRWTAKLHSTAVNHVKEKSSLMNMSASRLMGTCQRYNSMSSSSKKKYWAAFFRGVAFAESEYDINSSPKTGIMQLTCDRNIRTKYDCPCEDKPHLKHDSVLNLKCGMNIVDYWAQKNGQVFYHHPYFDVLRDNKHRKKVIKVINAYKPSSCG